jgi:lipoate-protein ligase A
MPATNNRSFRFIYSGKNEGDTNMAMDEAVMMGLAQNHSSPVLRIYRWTPPTISIGYFQNAADIDFEKAEKDGIGIVRRITGGRAVLHDEELTYSILFSAEDFKPFNKKDIFLFIARCLVDSLNLIGIRSKVVEKTKGDLRSPNCFASPAQYEIESIKEGKLIGSAQVIKNGVVLQHGAIPLTGSYTRITNYLKTGSTSFKSVSSLSSTAGIDIRDEELLKSLKKGFGNHLNLTEGNFNEYEKLKTKELAANKYSKKQWIYRK